MKASTALNILTELKPQEEIVMIILRESEIKEVTGPYYGELPRLTELVSRTMISTPDINGNYWYEKRNMFKELLIDGMQYIAKDDEEDRIQASNTELELELGLERYSISTREEIRPMKVLCHEDVNVIVDGRRVFDLDAGATYAELLTTLDQVYDVGGFFEGYTVADGHLTVHFGS